MVKVVEEMCFFEWDFVVDLFFVIQLFQFVGVEYGGDQIVFVYFEIGFVCDVEVFCEFFDDKEIGLYCFWWFDQFGFEQNMVLVVVVIDVVVFDEYGGWQDDIGYFGCFGQELFVYGYEEVFVGEVFVDKVLFGGDVYWIGILDQYGCDWWVVV